MKIWIARTEMTSTVQNNLLSHTYGYELVAVKSTFGRSRLTTWATPVTSKPRDATSVATCKYRHQLTNCRTYSNRSKETENINGGR